MAEQIRFSKSNSSFTFKAKTKDFTGKNIPVFPLPTLLITHTITESNITRIITDLEEELNENPSQGNYQRTFSSTIFSGLDISNYDVQISANISNEDYYENFILVDTVNNDNLSHEVVIQQFQNFYRQETKNFLTAAMREKYETDLKFKTMINAFGRYLDKTDQIIENLITLTRIDEVSDEYLRYMAQIVGYETNDFTINNLALRNIVSEIFNIYNLRGTEQGFKAFFRSLGYDAIIEEKWYIDSAGVQSEKPFVQTLGTDTIEPGDEWKISHLAGYEGSYLSYSGSSKILGSLDLIRGVDGEYRFVELYPSSVYSYNFDPTNQYRDNGTFNKSEQLTRLSIESFKDTELVPNILEQILNYIAFLKPIHIKLIVSILKQIEEHWWESGDIEKEEISEGVFQSIIVDGSTVKEGNIPREIDSIDTKKEINSKILYEPSIQFNPGFMDVGTGIDDFGSYFLTITKAPETDFTIPLYFDNDFSLEELERADFQLTGERYFPFLAETEISNIWSGGNPVYFRFQNGIASNMGYESWNVGPSLIGNNGLDYILNSSGLKTLDITGNKGLYISSISNKSLFKEVKDNTYIIRFNTQSALKNQWIFSQGDSSNYINIYIKNDSTLVTKINTSLATEIGASFIISSGEHSYGLVTSSLQTNQLLAKTYYDNKIVQNSFLLSQSKIDGHIGRVMFGNSSNIANYSNLDGYIKDFIVFENSYGKATIQHIFNKISDGQSINNDFIA